MGSYLPRRARATIKDKKTFIGRKLNSGNVLIIDQDTSEEALKIRLKKMGVPTLALDVEYGTSGSGQIRTRVQAFLEMLEARKK